MYTNVLNNGGFFAVGNHNVLICSMDGKSWIRCPPVKSDEIDIHEIKYIFKLSKALIAIVNNDDSFIYSYDCVTWRLCNYQRPHIPPRCNICYRGIDVLNKHIISVLDTYDYMYECFYTARFITKRNGINIIFKQIKCFDQRSEDLKVPNYGSLVQYNDKLILYNILESDYSKPKYSILRRYHDKTDYSSLCMDYIKKCRGNTLSAALYTDLIIRPSNDYTEPGKKCVKLYVKRSQDTEFNVRLIIDDDEFCWYDYRQCQVLQWANGYMVMTKHNIAYSENGYDWTFKSYEDLFDYKSCPEFINLPSYHNPTFYMKHVWYIPIKEDVSTSISLKSNLYDHQMEPLRQKRNVLTELKRKINDMQELRQRLERELEHELLVQIYPSINKLKSEINVMEELEHELNQELNQEL